MNNVNLEALNQAIDTTWNTSTPKTAQFSVTSKILSNNLLAMNYVTTVNLGSMKDRVLAQKKYLQEAQFVINQVLKIVKKKYQKHAEKSLKTKQVSIEDRFEVFGMNMRNTTRPAFFKCRIVFEIQ